MIRSDCIVQSVLAALRETLEVAWSEAIQNALRKSGLSLGEVSARTCHAVSQSTAKSWRNGNRLPSVIAACLGSHALGKLQIELRHGQVWVGRITVEADLTPLIADCSEKQRKQVK